MGYLYQISTQKKKTGVIAPKRFVQRVKKENELFRGYMHQVLYNKTTSYIKYEIHLYLNFQISAMMMINVFEFCVGCT